MQQPFEDRHAPKASDTRDRSDRKQDRPSRAEEMKDKRKRKKGDEIERVYRRESYFFSLANIVLCDRE